MKKIFTIIASLVLVFSVYAQDARQRTTETIVADVLAAMPAQDASQFNEQMKDLAAAAPESIIKVAKMMKPAGEGVRNSIYEYALSGVVSYVTDPAHKEYRTRIRSKTETTYYNWKQDIWGDWSSWSTAYVSSSDTRKVETTSVSGIKITSDYFPDANFRAILSNLYDHDHNSYLSPAEIEEIVSLELNYNVRDITGI